MSRTETAIVRVTDIRVQNSNGAIFRGEKIKPTGELIDTHSSLTVRLQARGIGIRVSVGQWWAVTGEVKSRTFINRLGFEMTEEQMEVRPGDARLERPENEHVIDYLKRNAAYRGIGEITGRKLWETFGKELFVVLDEGDATALSDVIGPKLASTLIQVWSEEGLSGSLQWLHAAGIPLVLGRRILDRFGKETEAKVKEDPYRLLSFSVDWEEVDDLARRELGVADDDERRLMGAVSEVVFHRFSRGDTYVPQKALVEGLRSLLRGENHPRALIDKAIEQSENARRLLFDSEGNAYSLGAVILENEAAEFIATRIGRNTAPSVDVSRIIKTYENLESVGARSKDERFKLNQEQEAAVRLVAENDISVVSGGAGCGKTTVLKCIREVLDEQGYRIVQLALAGKAAKRMSDATGQPAFTLASFIRNGPPEGPVAIVIDESSMVDLISFVGVIRRLPEDAKMVQVGDQHQLTPVGPGKIMHCLVDLPFVPHVELKAPKRFGSKLAKIANLIKDGIFPSEDQFDEEIRFIPASNNEMISRASALYLEKPDDTVVLCTTRTMAASINGRIHDSLTANNKPLRLFSEEFDCYVNTGFNEGDLVICTRNHWDLGVQNGSLGRLIEVFDDSDADEGEGAPALGRIEWDDGEIRLLCKELLDNLDLGYAMTVHKSQGSQWRHVISCLPSTSPNIDRSLVYTAVTRSQRDVAILGTHADLVTKVKREKAADRRLVGLKRRLEWLFQARCEVSNDLAAETHKNRRGRAVSLADQAATT